MNTKHTPGPWKAFHQEISGPNDELIGRVYAGTESAALLSKAISASTADNNARLIAAAPEMLAALELLLADPYLADPMNTDRMAGARAAIAKAKQDTTQ